MKEIYILSTVCASNFSDLDKNQVSHLLEVIDLSLINSSWYVVFSMIVV